MRTLTTLDLAALMALEQLLLTHSVTDAAAALHVGQPAMSRSLQKLRERLQDPLLVRVGRDMELTERARALLPHVSALLNDAERVLAPPEVFDPATAKGHVVVAIASDLFSLLATPLVQRVREQAPGLRVDLRPVSVATVREGERGDVDVVLFSDPKPLPETNALPDISAFVVRHVGVRPFLVAQAGQGPRRMSLREFVAREHVLVSIAGDEVGFVDHILRDLGHKRRVAVTVPTFDDAARMVAETDLVATLPASVVRQSPHALAWSTPPFHVPALDVLMVWHPRTTTSAKHKWLRDVVTKVWRGTDLGRARARS